MMYTTKTNRQKDRQLDRKEEEVASERQIDSQKNREIVRQRGGEGGSYRQIDVYNLEQQTDREIVRYRGGGDSYR